MTNRLEVEFDDQPVVLTSVIAAFAKDGVHIDSMELEAHEEDGLSTMEVTVTSEEELMEQVMERLQVLGARVRNLTQDQTSDFIAMQITEAYL